MPNNDSKDFKRLVKNFIYLVRFSRKHLPEIMFERLMWVDCIILYSMTTPSVQYINRFIFFIFFLILIIIYTIDKIMYKIIE